MEIVDYLYRLAKEHKSVKSFIYGRGYEKGAANEMHPLVWLDDPIAGSESGGVMRYTCNLDILGIPFSDKEVLGVQSRAFEVGLSIVERIRRDRGYNATDFSFLTLRDYYDNNSAGVRFTITIVAPNPIDLCRDPFDPAKEFPTMQGLGEFSTDAPEGCAIFVDKTSLPNFSL